MGALTAGGAAGLPANSGLPSSGTLVEMENCLVSRVNLPRDH